MTKHFRKMMSQWPVGTSLVTRGTHLGTVSPARGSPAAKVEKTENAGVGEAPALAVAQGASQGRRCGKTRLTSPPARREPGRKAPTAPEDVREHLRGGALLRGPALGPARAPPAPGAGPCASVPSRLGAEFTARASHARARRRAGVSSVERSERRGRGRRGRGRPHRALCRRAPTHTGVRRGGAGSFEGRRDREGEQRAFRDPGQFLFLGLGLVPGMFTS